MSFSRQSWPAAARGGTPSAASSAFSARRCRTPAAILTQKPVMASTAAAMATASSACCGTVDSGSLSSAAATPVVLVMAEPGGRSAARPARSPKAPDVASHHCVTGAASTELLVRMSWTWPRSTMRAPPLADTVGNVATAATIFTFDDHAVDVGLHRGSDARVARGQEALRGQAGQGRHRGCSRYGELARDRAGRHAGIPLGRQPVAGVQRHRQRGAARRPGGDGGQARRAAGAADLADACQFGRRGDGGPAAQHRPGYLGLPGPAGHAGQGEDGRPAGPDGGQRVVQGDRQQPQRVDGVPAGPLLPAPTA